MNTESSFSFNNYIVICRAPEMKCDTMSANVKEKKYKLILSGLKEKIKFSRQKAAFTLNNQLLLIYWEIGNTILQQQKKGGWGARIIDRLSIDLRKAFPDMKGFSIRNLKYMRAFAEAYPYYGRQSLNEKLQSKKAFDVIVQAPLAQLQVVESQCDIIVQAPLAQLTWYHHITLLDKVKDETTRLFYISKAVENGWSRNVLLLQIEGGLHLRQGNAITNFDLTLPKPQSDLAKETLKNPYLFEFLGIGNEIHERELEKSLIQHIKKFMLELGRGFAYVGNQFNLRVDDDDYFLDLLFYNYQLHCFIVFELKVGDFKPEYTGRLNFYINAVDEKIKGKEDKPTIGILLCKTPNDTVVKYALKGIGTPIGVADYEFTNALPTQLKGDMPSIEELEKEIEQEVKEFKEQYEKVDNKPKMIKKKSRKYKSSTK